MAHDARLAAALLCGLLCGAAACGTGPATTDGGRDVPADVPADAPADVAAPDLPPDVPGDPGPADPGPGVHGVTSATPMVDGSVLTDAHPGWKQADCAACHAPAHGGPRPTDCVFCHGTNGAPLRPLTHATAGCDDCHRNHAAVAPPFRSPDDCGSCHRYPDAGLCPAVQNFDAVVVGAGGGGLGAAAALARAGWRVGVVERQGRVGGYMTNFVRGPYRFEVSLHAMGGFDDGAPGTRELFADLGILDRVTPVKAPLMYRTWYPDGVVFDTPDGLDAYRDRLQADFPAEAEGIARLFADVPAMDAVLAAWQSGDDAFNAYLQQHPEDVGRFMQWAYGTLADALDDYVTDPRLTAILAQLSSYVGVEPANLSALYFFMMWNSYHLGGFYNFVGGSQSVSEALAQVVEENGGRIFLDTAATSIRVLDGKAVEVRTDGGPCLRGRWFVSNANAPATLELVGRDNVPADWAARIDAGKPGWPLVVVYLGVDADYTAAFGGAHEALIQDTWDTTEAYGSVESCDPGKSILLLANYSVLDATAAPPGHNVITITGTIGDACNDQWKWGDRGAFKDYKDAVAWTFIQRAEKALPGLRDHIVVYESAGPRTLQNFTLNPRGTIYGWHQTPDQSLLERLPQEVPGVSNLFLAGAWTFPGCGQSAVVRSGAMAAAKILAADAAARAR